MTSFADLGLAAPLLKALAAKGYETPTPIQLQAIPAIMGGRDLCGIAQTGTGKTAAFALPILHQLGVDRRPPPRRGCRVLVLSPTRELASQIAESFRAYGSEMNLFVTTIFGGVAHGPQIKALGRGIDVLVATPGRLVDHLDAGMANLSQVEYLVLDEVDQMLDLGFIKSIRHIVSKLPQKRRNLFFSATMPNEIGALASELLHEPVRIAVTPVSTTVERVDQQVLLVEPSRKREVLVGLFANEAMTRTIIFTRTKHGADKVAAHLEIAGISTSAIHGNKSQSQRERSLHAFRSGAVRALVATDIAARGIDIDGVTHVVNFDLPEVAESYVHRIGRTARAGNSGFAISLCAGDEHGLLRNIEKLTRRSLPVTDRRQAGGQAPIANDQGEGRPVRHFNSARPTGRSDNGRASNGRPGGSRPNAYQGAPRPSGDARPSRPPAPRTGTR